MNFQTEVPEELRDKHMEIFEHIPSYQTVQYKSQFCQYADQIKHDEHDAVFWENYHRQINLFLNGVMSELFLKSSKDTLSIVDYTNDPMRYNYTISKFEAQKIIGHHMNLYGFIVVVKIRQVKGNVWYRLFLCNPLINVIGSIPCIPDVYSICEIGNVVNSESCNIDRLASTHGWLRHLSTIKDAKPAIDVITYMMNVNLSSHRWKTIGILLYLRILEMENVHHLNGVYDMSIYNDIINKDIYSAMGIFDPYQLSICPYQVGFDTKYHPNSCYGVTCDTCWKCALGENES